LSDNYRVYSSNNPAYRVGGEVTLVLYGQPTLASRGTSESSELVSGSRLYTSSFFLCLCQSCPIPNDWCLFVCANDEGAVSSNLNIASFSLVGFIFIFIHFYIMHLGFVFD